MTLRLTMAQALVRYLAAQRTEFDGGASSRCSPACGRSSATATSPASARRCTGARDALPTYRAHNEQAMAHAAIAFAKASRRRRMMACTTSIGPGATNMVTAAAVAHVNRLPVLLLPGDVFANRRPDPVLQQVEDFADGTVSAQRLLPAGVALFRPHHAARADPHRAAARACAVLTDPAECGPVTLALCQDVQAEAFDYPESFFAERVWRMRRPRAGRARARRRGGAACGRAKKPLIVAGGGVLYAEAERDARRASPRRTAFRSPRRRPARARFADDHPLNMGAIGVTGTERRQRARGRGRRGARRRHAAAGFHHRLLGAVPATRTRRSSASTCSRFDAGKHGALPLVGDAKRRARGAVGGARRLARAARPGARARRGREGALARARRRGDRARRNAALPSDAQVIGAVQRGGRAVRHRRLRRRRPAGRAAQAVAGRASPAATTSNTAISCMGYEIAGGLGVKMARPEREVIVMVGDGSYLMMNSEIATSVMLGHEAHHRRARQPRLRLHQPPAARDRRRELQQPVRATRGTRRCPQIDFAAHAAASARSPRRSPGIAELEAALARARGGRAHLASSSSTPIRSPTTEAGGAWWDVAVPEVSERAEVRARARAAYEDARCTGAAAERRLTHGDPHRRQSDRLVERRPARARRRRRRSRPASPRRKRGRLRGHRARQQVPARADGAAGGARRASGWRSSRAGIRPSCSRRDVEDEIAALRPHLELLKALGCNVLVFAETSNAIHGDRAKPLAERPVLGPRRMAGVRRAHRPRSPTHVLAEGRAARLPPSHGHGGRSARPTSTRFMAATGALGASAARHRPRDLRRRRPGGARRAAIATASAMSTPRTCAPT